MAVFCCAMSSYFYDMLGCVISRHACDFSSLCQLMANRFLVAFNSTLDRFSEDVSCKLLITKHFVIIISMLLNYKGNASFWCSIVSGAI